MTDETQHKRFKEALSSLKEIVLNELDLIDLDATLKKDVSDEERQLYAEKEKTDLLVFIRKDIEGTIARMADLRRDGWSRLKAAGLIGLESDQVKAIGAAAAAGTALTADDEAKPSSCPPG